MKLLSSTFSSASSWSSSSTISTASPFDSKSATASCLAGIFRRILCSGTLPTHPSDHITEEGSASGKCFDEEGSNREAGLGLVARLMGLDSMPETDFRASISRSRSMGSADRDRARDSRHTRVKSSASFRELPTFLAFEDKEFLVLSFESASDRGRDSKSKQRRRVREKREDFEEAKKVLRDLNGKETTKRRNSVDHKRHSNEEQDPKIKLAPKKQLRQLHYVSSESSPNGAKPGLKKKKKYKKKMNMEVNAQEAKLLKPVELKSEDLSPVSVLDSGQFLVDPKVPISVCDSSSRRKLSLEAPPSPRRDGNLIETTELKREISRENSNALDEIWRASENELVGVSWARRWDFCSEDFRGVGEELEELIIGHLIDELVHQFHSPT